MAWSEGQQRVSMNPQARQAYASYRRMQVETASPHQLVAMLLHGAVVRCEHARAALEAGKPDEARPLLLRSQEIVAELMACLDFERGGDIARHLFLLYDFIHRRLVEANMRRDAGALDEALQLLRQLEETWEAIAPGRGGGEAGQASLARGPEHGQAAGGGRQDMRL